jgi:hypothetical protein
MKPFFLFLFLGIILGVIGNAQSDLAQVQMLQNDFTNFADVRIKTSSLMSFTSKEETVGRRYFFGKWVGGSVTNMKDSLFEKPGYLFNFDKISSSLLLTEDKKIILELDKDQIKSFTLRDEGKNYFFERLEINHNQEFFEPIVKNTSKYSLYKSLKTKFVKSNYYTDGIAESGNKYDEYVDEWTYYIILPGQKDFRKIDFKKKTILQALTTEEVKVDAYFSAHKNQMIDEELLKNLILYLD